MSVRASIGCILRSRHPGEHQPSLCSAGGAWRGLDPRILSLQRPSIRNQALLPQFLIPPLPRRNQSPTSRNGLSCSILSRSRATKSRMRNRMLVVSRKRSPGRTPQSGKGLVGNLAASLYIRPTRNPLEQLHRIGGSQAGNPGTLPCSQTRGSPRNLEIGIRIGLLRISNHSIQARPSPRLKRRESKSN